MDARKVAFARAWKQWGESGDAEVPAREVSMKEIAAKATVPVLGTAEVVRQAVTASPDPTPHIETTKRVVESASLLKSIATTGADFLGWVAAHPGMLGAAVLAVAAVWFGPALWRKFA
jgi:hypothetical protein